MAEEFDLDRAAPTVKVTKDPKDSQKITVEGISGDAKTSFIDVDFVTQNVKLLKAAKSLTLKHLTVKERAFSLLHDSTKKVSSQDVASAATLAKPQEGVTGGYNFAALTELELNDIIVETAGFGGYLDKSGTTTVTYHGVHMPVLKKLHLKSNIALGEAAFGVYTKTKSGDTSKNAPKIAFLNQNDTYGASTGIQLFAPYLSPHDVILYKNSNNTTAGNDLDLNFGQYIDAAGKPQAGLTIIDTAGVPLHGNIYGPDGTTVVTPANFDTKIYAWDIKYHVWNMKKHTGLNLAFVEGGGTDHHDKNFSLRYAWRQVDANPQQQPDSANPKALAVTPDKFIQYNSKPLNSIYVIVLGDYLPGGKSSAGGLEPKNFSALYFNKIFATKDTITIPAEDYSTLTGLQFENAIGSEINDVIGNTTPMLVTTPPAAAKELTGHLPAELVNFDDGDIAITIDYVEVLVVE